MKFIGEFNSQQLDILRSKGVVFTDFILGGTSGILLDTDNADRALTTLSLVSADEKPSNYEGIVRVTLKANQSAASTLDAVHAKFRQQYIAASSRRSEELFAQTREALIQLRQKTESLQTSIVLELRAAAMAERKAKGLAPIDREAYAREFDALAQVPKVRAVLSEPGSINIYTEMLHSSDPRTGKRHEIGAFVIKIYLDGQADGVRWFNLTRRINAARNQQQAPSVLTSGRACFAEIRESFPDLIANMQLSAIATLAIDFIEQVNVEDAAGERIDQWPVSGK